jgi:hypothetical protein
MRLVEVSNSAMKRRRNHHTNITKLSADEAFTTSHY